MFIQGKMAQSEDWGLGSTARSSSHVLQPGGIHAREDEEGALADSEPCQGSPIS